MKMIFRLCEDFAACLAGRGIEPNTIRNYCANIRRFFLFLQDNFGWDANQQIQVHHFRGYYLSLFLAGRDKPRTVETKLSILRSWAEFSNLKLPTCRDFLGPLPSLGELCTLFAFSQKQELRDQLLFTLFLCYGFTSSELIRLKVTNIDLKKKQLTINLNNNLYPRTLPLISTVSKQLENYIRVMKPQTKLLVNINGQPLTEAGLRYILKLLLAKAQLPNYTYRDIRRGWLKHISKREPLAVVLALSGLGPQLPGIDYRLVLEDWQGVLANGNPFLGVMNGRGMVSSPPKGSGNS